MRLASYEGDIISSSFPFEVTPLSGRFDLKIIPSLSILAGRLVVTREGSYHILKKNNQEISIAELIDRMEKSYDCVHMVDLDSITRGKTQLGCARDVSEKMEVWYDGGFFSSEEIYDPIMMGVRNIVLGTKSITDMNTLLDCFELTPNMVFELDYHDGIMSPSKEISTVGVSELVNKVRAIGIKEMIVADFGRMEDEGEINIPLIKRIIAEGFKTYAAGNVTPEDLPALQKIGAAGAILKLESILS